MGWACGKNARAARTTKLARKLGTGEAANRPPTDVDCPLYSGHNQTGWTESANLDQSRKRPGSLGGHCSAGEVKKYQSRVPQRHMRTSPSCRGRTVDSHAFSIICLWLLYDLIRFRELHELDKRDTHFKDLTVSFRFSYCKAASRRLRGLSASTIASGARQAKLYFAPWSLNSDG